MAVGDLWNVTTNEVRLSYVHVFKPYAYNEGDDPKYSCTILIPKSDTETMNKIWVAIDAAKKRGGDSIWNGVIPPNPDVVLYDGDGTKQDGTPFSPECAGHWVLSAKSQADRPPEIVDQNMNKILDQTQVYSGCYARVNVDFYPYINKGKKGISCSLGPIQKLRDGEPLGGQPVTAAQAFGAPATQQTYPATPGYPQPQGYSMPQQAYQAPVQQPMRGAVDPITGMPMQ